MPHGKKNFSRDPYIVLFIFLTAVLMLMLNRLTPMLVDDYRYCFSFVKGRPRMVSLSQLIPSMQAHYQSMNGRVITHGIVQLILMKCPAAMFDLINAGMFVLLCWLIYDLTWRMGTRETNAFFYLVVAASVWAFTPAFGEVFLWLDGSCNYLWPAALLLLYLRPVIKGTFRQFSVGSRIVYTAAGIVMGGLSETVSMAAMGWLFFRFLYDRLIEKKDLWIWYLFPIATMAPSYLFMIFSPGTRKNKLNSDLGFAGRFVSVYMQYAKMLACLIVVWVMLAVCVCYLRKTGELFFKSCIFVLLSLGMNFMHCFTNSYPHRGMIGVTVFLMIADGLLLTLLWDTPYRLAVLLISVGSVLYAAYLFVPGVYDIGKTYKAMRQNEQILENAVETGEKKVSIPDIHPETKYSSIYDLKYIDTQKEKNWPNNSIAQYYGLKSVTGTEAS